MQKRDPLFLFQRVVLLALSLRVIAAFFSTGFEHPHEIYRTLEPIAHLNRFSTDLPYEWKDRMLSQLPIFFQFHLLQWVKVIFHTDSPSLQVIVLKILYGSLSIFPLLAIWRFTRSLWACLFFAIWPELIFRSVQLMDYSIEMGFLGLALWIGLPVSTDRSPSPWRTGAAGVILGILFFVRFQSGLYLIGLFLALAFYLAVAGRTPQARNQRQKTLFCLASLGGAYGATIGILGTAEAALTRGYFLEPFVNYLNFNVVLNGAVQGWGAQPWHRMITELFKYFGYFPVLIVFIELLRGSKTLKNKIDLRWACLFGLPFAAHCLIQHKEARFIFGFAWTAIPLAAAILGSTPQLQTSTSRKALFMLMMTLGFGLDVYRITPRAIAGRQLVQDFTRIGDQLAERQSQSHDLLPLVISTHSPASPGAFFLRYRGPLCYGTPATCQQAEGRPYLDLSERNGKWLLQKRPLTP